MLSISAPRTSEAATAYYLAMEKDSMGKIGEYYAKEGEVGHWLGVGAKTLGLAGSVIPKDFVALCRGFDQHGHALVRNADSKGRRAGWDLTFSAPKSVSVAWSVADDAVRASIDAAHRRSVECAFAFVQEKAGLARTGAQGQALEKGELIAAAFTHGTSREQDAQLHTHVFVMNTVLRNDGTAASLASEKIFEYKMAAGAVYQCSLAHEVGSLGYKLERDGDESFRIASVPEELEDEQSTRRHQILHEMAISGTSGSKAAAVATLATRAAKKEVEIDSLRSKWAEQAFRHGYGAEQARPEKLPLEVTNNLREAHSELPLKSDKVLVPGALLPNASQILEAATEHQAVVRDAQIQMHSYRAAICVDTPQAASVLADRAKSAGVSIERSDGSLDRKGPAYSTPELIKAERDIVRIAVSRKDDREHILSDSMVVDAVLRCKSATGHDLNDEQLKALRGLATEPGGVRVLVGDAGTGKSTTMFALREAYQTAGFGVLGTSTGGKQSAELMRSAGIDSRNLRQLEVDTARAPDLLDAKTVLVVDEAGMTDSRQMAMVMRLAQATGAKVVLVGDHKQLQPVGAGATFLRIAQEIGSVRLMQNQRQHAAWERKAVNQMSRGEALSALASYVENDRVAVEKSFEKAVKEVVRRHLLNVGEVGAERAMVIASTHVAVSAINTGIREELKKLGQLKAAKVLETRHAKIELAVGDRIVMCSPGRGRGFENGDSATVQSLGRKGKLEILLDRTGQHITLDTPSIDLAHGYAMTTHKCQGSTYERATVYLTAQTSREMAYVQASRARESTHFVTSSHHLRTMAEDFEASAEVCNLVDEVAARRMALGKSSGLDALTKDSFMAALTYLKANEKYLPGVSTMASDKEMLRQLAHAMGKSRPKESTLDYRVTQGMVERIKEQKGLGTSMSDAEFKAAIDELSAAIERDRLEKESQGKEAAKKEATYGPEIGRWPSFEMD
jgi:conjugative relaxase-like TrwC/TraI family protein